MEGFEKRALDQCSSKPKVWRRYMCYIARENLDRFLEYLKNIEESIKFTIEVEENNQFPFLDVLVPKQNGPAKTVYRKPTNTGQYLHFEPKYNFST